MNDMNTPNAMSAMRVTHAMNGTSASVAASEASPWLHAWMWLCLAVAGALLTGFIAVIHGAVERGEQRREYQSLSGSRLLPDEMQSEGVAMADPAWVSVERVASAEAQ